MKPNRSLVFQCFLAWMFLQFSFPSSVSLIIKFFLILFLRRYPTLSRNYIYIYIIILFMNNIKTIIDLNY